IEITMTGESSKKQNKTMFIQAKLSFSISIEPAASQEKEKHVTDSCILVPKKREEPETILLMKKNTLIQKALKLDNMLLDENFEKLDE
ncbi:31327_t:CDS:1, partial [Gigaspora margarita]